MIRTNRQRDGRIVRPSTDRNLARKREGPERSLPLAREKMRRFTRETSGRVPGKGLPESSYPKIQYGSMLTEGLKGNVVKRRGMRRFRATIPATNSGPRSFPSQGPDLNPVRVDIISAIPCGRIPTVRGRHCNLARAAPPSGTDPKDVEGDYENGDKGRGRCHVQDGP